MILTTCGDQILVPLIKVENGIYKEIKLTF